MRSLHVKNIPQVTQVQVVHRVIWAQRGGPESQSSLGWVRKRGQAVKSRGGGGECARPRLAGGGESRRWGQSRFPGVKVLVKV